LIIANGGYVDRRQRVHLADEIKGVRLDFDVGREAGQPFAVVAEIMGWSAGTAVRMAKRYGHIGDPHAGMLWRLWTLRDGLRATMKPWRYFQRRPPYSKPRFLKRLSD
jgi:hypothetical protein